MSEKDTRKGRPRLRWLSFGAVVGAGVSYLADPEMGRTRRARLQQQAGRVLRRGRRRVEGEAERIADKAKGTITELRHPPQSPEDDRTLVDKVRSEVLGDADFRDHTINVDAYEGVVTLRGQLPERALIEHLERAVARVTGVAEVRSLLHTPDEPVPDAASAGGSRQQR